MLARIGLVPPPPDLAVHSGPFQKPSADNGVRESQWNKSANNFRRILWLLENDMTRGVFSLERDWDSHLDNLAEQEKQSMRFFPLLAKFLEMLGSRSNAHGNLLDNTLIVIGSEIGRYPRLNSFEGKDHFPEAPFMLIGKSVNTSQQVYGRTGRMH